MAALLLVVFRGPLFRAVSGRLVTIAERFRVRQVLVDGEHLLTKDAVLKAAGVPLASAMFRVSTEVVETRLESQPWIKRARVSRRFPDTIEILITEREPIAAIRQQSMIIVTADSMAVPPPSERWVWDLPLLLPPHSVQTTVGRVLRDAETLALLNEAVTVRRVSVDSWQNLSELYYRGDEIYASLARPTVELRLGHGVGELAWTALASYFAYGEDRPADGATQLIDLRFAGKVIVTAGRPIEERLNG
ncbi:FtsQ-type POTRA domain-containing protein [candidate division KSB1 bacterium]|nr:FtsQ-type POTRA domain-containing protein [candidate division KSB1 bacterium]